MSAYKQFITNEVTITPFEVHKEFSLSGDEITGSNIEIELYTGYKHSSLLAPLTSSGFVNTTNTQGVYNSVKQLYYSNYQSSSLGDNVPTRSILPGASKDDESYYGSTTAPRFDNYLQSTLTQSRHFPTGSNSEISVISIPSKLFGENIVPQTFELTYTQSGGGFDIHYTLLDDGEGNIKASAVKANGDPYSVEPIMGQIFYAHGLITLTTGSLTNISSASNADTGLLSSMSIDFRSSLKIYENQYRCVVRENEFNGSLNPSLASGSDNNYLDFATGSIFTPYVTTVGLYNNEKTLIAVGKLSEPLPISKYSDTTIVISFDT